MKPLLPQYYKIGHKPVILQLLAVNELRLYRPVLRCLSRLTIVLAVVFIVIHLRPHFRKIDVAYISKSTPDMLDEARRPFPKIIHQSWKTDCLPTKFEHWSATWKANHPNWTYILWTDEENRNLVSHHYPWFLSTYDSLPKPIMRADAARYIYMHKYGGVYADLDMESLRPLDDLVEGRELILGQMGTQISPWWQHSLPNAWMASKPNHSYWMHCLQDIMNTMEHRRSHGDPWLSVNAEYVTGPAMLHRVFLNYIQLPLAQREPVFIADADIVFPYDWSNISPHYQVCAATNIRMFNVERCKALVTTERTVSITYWSHSWEPQMMNADLTTEMGLEKM
ncbi:nucleotide-diphospho-sugar transferase [Polychytrium aggregatum]|uniref:nucleotide-diphospho-sugar transferase n=1 Tax=Polychytrium aggregatum TaxID=110093 RepID=UPI0022FDD3A8|nr:nucleotide-diphospho-sugar transferase [Polychytrium aggregatum]KAI9192968.1 nucleotide-diphospho-sugar transferase [Polychytrium aggregatum]